MSPAVQTTIKLPLRRTLVRQEYNPALVKRLLTILVSNCSGG